MTESVTLGWVFRRCFAAIILLLGFLALTGCAPTLVQVLKQDPRDPERYVRVSAPGAVTVFRAGRPIAWSAPQVLQPGDVIQTGPEAAAIIRLPEGHEIVLDEETRVRLGSFIVEFGRLLARARGFFEVESENVVAGVEGTEFVFQTPRSDRSVSVTVLEGSVVCRSKIGAWAPVRLRPRERFSSAYPHSAAPEKRPATDDEMDEIRHWVRRIDASFPPPPPVPLIGYCCTDGRVFPASRERCAGQYFADRGIAETLCRRAPDQGYCCSDGRVFPSNREGCVGSFHSDAWQARRDCRPLRQNTDPPAADPTKKRRELLVPTLPSTPVIK
jgi:hypothetical protein